MLIQLNINSLLSVLRQAIKAAPARILSTIRQQQVVHYTGAFQVRKPIMREKYRKCAYSAAARNQQMRSATRQANNTSRTMHIPNPKPLSLAS
jgi:hypothetical protein